MRHLQIQAQVCIRSKPRESAAHSQAHQKTVRHNELPPWYQLTLRNMSNCKHQNSAYIHSIITKNLLCSDFTLINHFDHTRVHFQLLRRQYCEAGQTQSLEVASNLGHAAKTATIGVPFAKIGATSK